MNLIASQISVFSKFVKHVYITLTFSYLIWKIACMYNQITKLIHFFTAVSVTCQVTDITYKYKQMRDYCLDYASHLNVKCGCLSFKPFVVIVPHV